MKKWHLRLIIGAAIIFIVSLAIYFLHDPLDDYNGPSYIPSNYSLVRNNTTENSTFLLYQGSGRLNFFLVGVTRDPNKTFFNSIKSSFNSNTTQNANLLLFEENVNVIDHQITVKREEINVFGNLISFFETSWYCDETKMTFIASGVVPSSEIPEINKMIQSIKCHRPFFF